MTDGIKQDNRVLHAAPDKDDRLAQLADLLNQGTPATETQSRTEPENAEKAPSCAPIYIQGDNNIVSTQSSTVIVKNRASPKRFWLFACAALFF